MLQNDLYYTLALLQVEGIGDILAKKLIQNCGSAEAVFKSKSTTLAKIEGIGKTVLKNLQDPFIFQKTEKELLFIENENISTWHYLDDLYPERLKQCFDAPVLLFTSGNISLKNQKIISIVGTRQVTTYGSEMTKKIIEELAPLQPIIVSGFAYGVDIVAHQAAMEFGLQTIGVLAHGLNQIYPKSHKKYMVKMEEKGGFLTEFWSNSKPDRENFVKRNRIVAGISEATIVIESAEKGGSLITAQIANDYNRDVFAVPGRTTDKYSQGCNNLIKTQRAYSLTCAADLLYNLNWDIDSKKIKEEKGIQKQLFVSLTEEEEKIYNYLLVKNSELIDIISLECDFPIFKTSSILLNMELKGIIRPLPGKIFELI
ncbi:DNA-protecting protein DprA [Flavobacterium sp. 9AF]|uniref:DNA-processing protein DprA n=1 Tax=Flavobacterium sp. 9AF TaxID=2653142 RepID=UPI0012F0DCF4|nr:DNA-processing protein DprA [Flavobacterium sp. 9AF]VXC08998.1 DNA-protecting protein DprA [Flavobacterium sp. 9AF]